MLDLSFIGRGELSSKPIVIKDADAIWHRTQDYATMAIVAMMTGLMVYLIAR